MGILFDLVPILVVVIFAFSFLMIISPKIRGKFMSRQLKANRYMMENSKKDLEQMGAMAGNLAVNMKKNMLDQNEDILKDMATREANIEKDAIEIKAKAVKEGLKKDSIYCKHCGQLIDSDSKFCKSCGKEQ